MCTFRISCLHTPCVRVCRFVCACVANIALHSYYAGIAVEELGSHTLKTGDPDFVCVCLSSVPVLCGIAVCNRYASAAVMTFGVKLGCFGLCLGLTSLCRSSFRAFFSAKSGGGGGKH